MQEVGRARAVRVDRCLSSVAVFTSARGLSQGSGYHQASGGDNEGPGLTTYGSKVLRSGRYRCFEPVNKRYLAFVAQLSPDTRTSIHPLASGRQFNFRPELVKRRRRKASGGNSNRPKKRWEAEHETMHELAHLTSDQELPTKEDLRAISLQEFIANIERGPQRKRLPPPAEAHEPSYGAIMYLKGLPYEATEEDVIAWLAGYKVREVVLIKDENACFTGDAYVRCGSIDERDRMHREMPNATMGVRIVRMFRLTESAYVEYYHTGFRRSPARRNYISPSFLVAKHGAPVDPVAVSQLATGNRITGVVTQIFRNGMLVDCGVHEVVSGVRERVFCVLMRNRVAKNVGVAGQQREWLRTKELVLFPGIRLNLYVEKVRQTTAQSAFEEDLWREHFGEPFESLNTASDLPKRSMVYLTMDSSVSEDKVRWWEQRLVDSYAKFTLSEESTPSRIQNEELFQKVAVTTDWLGGRPKVSCGEVAAGRVVLVGNKKLVEQASTFAVQHEDPVEPDADDHQPYHELVREFLRGSDVDRFGTHYHGFDEPGGYKEPGEVDYSAPPKVYVLGGGSSGEAGASDPASAGYSEYLVPEVRLPPLTPPLPPSGTLNVETEARRRATAEEFKVLPRTTLFDNCIQLPGSGWLLRSTDVPKLASAQVSLLLRQLGKCPSEDTENADFENRMLLCQVIKEQGLGTGLDPKTLIAKGLYKVKQSKKKMKRLITLTKNLTGRKFTREDLDAASKDELQMLAEESLRKFAQWDPAEPVKRTFVDMYGGILGDPSADSTLSERWDALKWHVVLQIYGEQSDLKEILRDIEANDQMLGAKPGSSAESLESMVHSSIAGMSAGGRARKRVPKG